MSTKMFAPAMIALLLLIAACSGDSGGFKPEADRPGLCKLNCDSAIIGANDAVFKLTGPESSTITCNASEAGASFEVEFSWVLTETFKNGDVENFRPVPGISMGINLFGGVSSVTTEKTLMCTDACGVFRSKVALTCPPAGATTSTTLHAYTGALISTNTVIELQTTTE